MRDSYNQPWSAWHQHVFCHWFVVFCCMKYVYQIWLEPGYMLGITVELSVTSTFFFSFYHTSWTTGCVWDTDFHFLGLWNVSIMPERWESVERRERKRQRQIDKQRNKGRMGKNRSESDKLPCRQSDTVARFKDMDTLGKRADGVLLSWRELGGEGRRTSWQLC